MNVLCVKLHYLIDALLHPPTPLPSGPRTAHHEAPDARGMVGLGHPAVPGLAHVGGSWDSVEQHIGPSTAYLPSMLNPNLHLPRQLPLYMLHHLPLYMPHHLPHYLSTTYPTICLHRCACATPLEMWWAPPLPTSGPPRTHPRQRRTRTFRRRSALSKLKS